ncbi:MAG: ExbD/TolR family protein [Phycisphaerales bacterium]
MRRPRRQTWDIRFELAPMLDVVFILLTFFIFAMVLSKRFTVTDIRLPRAGTGTDASAAGGAQAGAIVVSLRPGGEVRVDDQPVPLDQVPARIAEARKLQPGADVFLAPDVAAASGDLFALMDTLAKAGIRDLRFLRQDAQAPAPAAPLDAGSPTP